MAASCSIASTRVIYPVSPTTDHLGALLLAPLNIAWLLQAWILMGITAYGVERRSLLAAEIGIVIWIVAATAVGQVVAWTVEAIRRTPHGIAIIRSLGLALAAAAVMLQLTHNAIGLLDSLKTRWLVVGYVDGFGMRWVESIGVELALLVVAVVLGAVPAHLAARRAPRDELRVETGNHLARRLPARRWPCWCAPTGARSGGRCPCAAASPSSRSAPASWRWPATWTGRR